MSLCNQKQKFRQGLDIYWEKYRQHSKQESSKRDILDFCDSYHQSLK